MKTQITNFLSKQKQTIVVDGARSDYINVRLGVPQGSVLGPCLFLAYINNLPDSLIPFQTLHGPSCTASSSVFKILQIYKTSTSWSSGKKNGRCPSTWTNTTDCQSSGARRPAHNKSTTPSTVRSWRQSP